MYIKLIILFAEQLIFYKLQGCYCVALMLNYELSGNG